MSMALPSKELPEQALDALIVRERTRIVAPLTEWRALSVQLRDEGIIRAPQDTGYESARRERSYTGTPPSVGRRPGWRPAVMRWTARVGGMAALFLGGLVVGRGMTLGNQVIDTIRLAISDSTGSGSRVRVSGKPFSSVDDARHALAKSQTEYERAAAFLAASDTSPHVVTDPSVYRDRLAALDEMAAASQSALRSAPDDPLLNQYYLSAVAAREATLRQLGNALPQGVTVVRY
ncbi:MAG TPA: hypothetical protein VGT98_16715 [Candidatus Elarobacter sp.]|nr:hypothetical protein [Candidatus Elarobacter sp.]